MAPEEEILGRIAEEGSTGREAAAVLAALRHEDPAGFAPLAELIGRLYARADNSLDTATLLLAQREGLVALPNTSARVEGEQEGSAPAKDGQAEAAA